MPPSKRAKATSTAHISSLCESVNRLVSGIIPPSPTRITATPGKKDHAGKMIKLEEGLSLHSLVCARVVFRRSDDVAAEYLSFDNTDEDEREARAYWLQNEMDRISSN